MESAFLQERGINMGMEGKYYDPPRIWPGLLEMDEQLSPQEDYPFPYLIRSGGSLLGLFFGLDNAGVEQITSLLETNEDLHCKLIIGIYPACDCGYQELDKMFALQNDFQDRVDFRLYVINSIDGGTSSSLLFMDESSENSVLVTGPLGFNSRQLDPAGTSFVFRPETALLKEWTNWFDYVWIKHAIPLNSFTAQIPPLIPVEASEEVIKIWGDYLQTCHQSQEYSEEQKAVRVQFDKETGELVAMNQAGQEIPLPSKELNIPQISPLVERISRLYSAGKLVSFNKLTRIPPLDCPARAEWFGVESLRTVGTVTREIRYRISALDPEELKKFNNLKKNGTDLLRRLGFALGDGLHWMPNTMTVLLQKELDRIASDALGLITGAMGINTKDNGVHQALLFELPKEETDQEAKQRKEIIKAFIKKRQKRIITDANRIYKEFRPGAKLEQTAIDAITSELESRLGKVLTGNVLPEVVQNRVAFYSGHSGGQAVVFDQPLLLLRDLAVFPRMILSEDRFYLRGIKIDAEVLLEAIDVCGDQIIPAAKQGSVRSRAILELSLLEEIMQAEDNNEVKCRAILALIDGLPIDKVQEMYKRREQVEYR